MDQDSFYIDGAKRMVAEGMETVSKIMAHIKQHEHKLTYLSKTDRKKEILSYEPAKLFNQVHPIVFHYIAAEGVFNAAAFKRYVMSVFGKPKDMKQHEQMRGNRKLVYQFKNAQQALYYKYLMIETNPNINKNTIHAMYEEVVQSLNADTDKMIDAYEKAQEEAKIIEDELTNQKRNELVELLRKKI